MAQRDDKKLNGAGLGTLWTRIKNLIGSRVMDGVPISTGIHYASCSTVATDPAKTVSLTGFTLVTGAEITVRFTVTNTAAAANLTLNVNSTGAKGIRYRNAVLPSADKLYTGRTYRFVYDGTYWQIVGDLDTFQAYSSGTAAIIEAGTNTEDRVWNAKVLKDYIDSQRLLPLGRYAGSQTAYAANSMVSINNAVYVSNTETSNTPVGVLTDNDGSRIVLKTGDGNGYGIVNSGTSDDWDKLMDTV